MRRVKKNQRFHSGQKYRERVKQQFVDVTIGFCRGISSVGRVLRSHRRGQGFESPILHLFCTVTDYLSSIATIAIPDAAICFS